MNVDKGGPLCFYPADYMSYSVDSIKESDHGARITATLRRPSPYNGDAKKVITAITSLSPTLWRIKVGICHGRMWKCHFWIVNIHYIYANISAFFYNVKLIYQYQAMLVLCEMGKFDFTPELLHCQQKEDVN